MHLFFECSFARKCWDKLGITWTQESDIHRRISTIRHITGMPYFMDIFLIAAWELWKVKNRLVFDEARATYSAWLRNFKEEASLQAHRLNDDDRVLVNFWLDSL